jgi:Helix-turn-helix domain
MPEMTQVLESCETTRTSQKERILALLREAGHQGVSNLRLNLVCFRYGARLHELRAEGYRIETISSANKSLGSCCKSSRESFSSYAGRIVAPRRDRRRPPRGMRRAQAGGARDRARGLHHIAECDAENGVRYRTKRATELKRRHDNAQGRVRAAPGREEREGTCGEAHPDYMAGLFQRLRDVEKD